MSRKLHRGPYDYDDDEDYVPTKKVTYSAKDNTDLVGAKQHTLDSDEEDEDTKIREKSYDVLRDEDIDGQEASTIDFEGDTKITPFNMKEELEEGHFDRDGFYHFKKNTEELKDAWLDNIDWIKVQHIEEEKNKYGSDEDSSDSMSTLKSRKETEAADKKNFDLYEQLFVYIQPQESVTVALKRLGRSKTKKRLTTAEKWKLKKQGKLAPTDDSNLETFLKVTEIINEIVATGYMEIYEETYETINLKLQKWKRGNEASSQQPSVDIFADETPVLSNDREQAVDKSTTKVEEVKWEYRWEDKDEADISGPFTTSQMIKWKDTDYFRDGVFVRKISDRDGPWYHSSRIDFDLYT